MVTAEKVKGLNAAEQHVVKAAHFMSALPQLTRETFQKNTWAQNSH